MKIFLAVPFMVLAVVMLAQPVFATEYIGTLSAGDNANTDSLPAPAVMGTENNNIPLTAIIIGGIAGLTLLLIIAGLITARKKSVA